MLIAIASVHLLVLEFVRREGLCEFIFFFHFRRPKFQLRLLTFLLLLDYLRFFFLKKGGKGSVMYFTVHPFLCTLYTVHTFVQYIRSYGMYLRIFPVQLAPLVSFPFHLRLAAFLPL